MTDEDKGGRVSAVLDESLYFLLLALPWRGGRESEKTFWERWGSEVGKESGGEGGIWGDDQRTLTKNRVGRCSGTRGRSEQGSFEEYLNNSARADKSVA